ncbi:MAG: HPr(Ser) kinase/phosphatase [Ruminococcaceae bacterium]|nr:HPr(Ser) kinase/phosphatase [Oscillospiraceae bacterium]
MEEIYSIKLTKIMKEMDLTALYLPENATDIEVTSPDVERPGLALTGFFEKYENTRIQIFGRAESAYLEELSPAERDTHVANFMKLSPVAVIFSSDLPVFEEVLKHAKLNGIPVLTSHRRTSALLAAIIAYLHVQLAPRITRHGVLVEVYGEGILILGDSGVGKSETAIELVKRGHRLIADDAVEIKRVSATTLVGSAPEIIRHYVELRGIGIVDIKRLFGVGSVKDTEKIDLVVNLEPWVQGKMYDRLGIDNETIDILGINVPAITIPVRPGRNLAIILEIAAMNNRQKRMGYNTALEFSKQLMNQMGGDPEEI